jgi:hypothetical protein
MALSARCPPADYRLCTGTGNMGVQVVLVLHALPDGLVVLNYS